MQILNRVDDMVHPCLILFVSLIEYMVELVLQIFLCLNICLLELV